MNVNVTKIERLSNGIIQFYNGNDVVDSFSITSSVSVLFENNLAKSISFVSNVKTLSFNVYNIQSVYGSTSNKIYSSGIDPSDTGSAYISRLYDIYAFIISDVIQGCCPGPTFVGGVVVTYPDYASFPATGQESVIYIDEATNQAYFWDGSSYQPLISVSSADKMTTIGRNSTGSTLYKGTIIYISGSTGNRPNYVKAQANSEATSAGTFGVILSDIANNSDGYAVTIGTIDNLDTRSTAPNPFTSDTLVDGDTIYLSPTTAGYVTNVKPYAPDHLVYVGKVVRTSPTNGVIVYRIQNGYELDELHDVAAQTPSNNDGLFFESSTSLWKNKSISTVLGYTPFNLPSLTSGSVLFSNGTTIAQDNANLFWDDTNNRLGIGTASPNNSVHISDGTSLSSSITDSNAYLFLSRNNASIGIWGSVASNTFTHRTVFASIRAGGTTASPTAVSSGFQGLTILSGLFDGSSIQYSAGLFFDAESNASAGNAPQLINLVTGSTGANRSTKLQVRSNGNVIIQNGGTFTDAGYRLDVNGSVRTTGSISAASAIARGTYLNQTLVATANNDVLVGLDIQPTFTLGAFTNVYTPSLRVTGPVIFNTSQIGTANNRGLRLVSTSAFNEIFFNVQGGANDDGQFAFGVQNAVNGYAYFYNRMNGSIIFGTNNSTKLQIFNTGNVTIQNSGTFTDAGYRLDVNGSVRTTGSISAASAIARGTFLNQTLVATANNDVLVGLDIAPTFTAGAFTGVQQEHLVIRGNNNPIIRFKNVAGTTTWGQFGANASELSFNAQGGALNFVAGNTQAMYVFASTRNVVIQNGGTFTDAGYRLDVNGSVRTTGSISAASALARGTYLNQTLVATANNDFLVALDIQPTFTTGAFTGVRNYAIRCGTGDIYTGSFVYAAGVVGNAGITISSTGTNNVSLATSSTGSEKLRIFGSTGNVTIQNGGTFTDVASSRLTINSTTQGILIPRMTSTERDAITSPATGLQIFNTTTSCVEYFDSFWGWMPVNANSQWYASYGMDYFNDTPAGDGVIGAGASGAGANGITGANVLSVGQGNVTFITGTTSSGTYRIVSNSYFTLGNGRIVNEYYLTTPVLSTSTERYVTIIGFQDVFGINQVDGAYFLYDEGGVTSGSTATPNFQCVTSSNSVRTFTTTSVVNNAGVLSKFRIEINDAATQVLFYINNVLVATHTTNIPVGTARSAQWGILVQKQVGTTSIQAVCVDYYLFKQKWVTAR